MRHGATLLSALEGLNRQAYHIARELAFNSRSGLTPRFLAKKLDVPIEEIEYLVDLNHHLFFGDLTKIKLVAEGPNALKRIGEGLENRGDVDALFRRVKSMTPHEFRLLEERLGIEKPGSKKAAAEHAIETIYSSPEDVVAHVARDDLSSTAKEVFDVVYQSKKGILPIAKIREAVDASPAKVEQALEDLFDGLALFEMFRFDDQDRLVRWAALLSELRHWRESDDRMRTKRRKLQPLRTEPSYPRDAKLSLSDTLCRLVAAIAARPARLRGDGEPFREDRRRLNDIVPDDDEPSLATCLWIAKELDWLAQVDNELRAANLEPLLDLAPLDRHMAVVDWMLASGNEPASRGIFASVIEDLKPGAWYSMTGFIEHAIHAQANQELPVLRNQGGHWRYVSPTLAQNAERALARSIEETYTWLGLVALGDTDEGAAFALTPLGHAVLGGGKLEKLRDDFPARGAEIVVQPNFDIVVPSQETDPLLTVPLDQFCVRLSTGTATVYSLTKDSFTRALQEGFDGQAFVTFLLEHNRGGSLPPNVSQTLEDWRGGLKRVRVRTINVIESDDPLVIADLMHRRGLRKHVEQPDPKRLVTFNKISKSELIKGLEKEGFVIQ